MSRKRKYKNGNPPKQNLQQNVNMWENNFWYLHYFNLFYNLALCRYKWINLPETVDERYLECMLIDSGACIYFNEPELGDICLAGTMTGELSIYGIPTLRKAIGVNGQYFYRKIWDSVIIWNNRLHVGNLPDIQLYAQRCAMYTQIENINVNVQSTPAIILCDEKDKMSLQNLFIQYDGKAPLIKGYKGLALDQLQVINLEAPFIADKVASQKHRIINEYFSFMGINNANQEKKEREVVPEANGNYESVLMGREIGLITRKQAAEQINAMFGTSIDVVYNPSLDRIYEHMFIDEKQYVDTDSVKGAEEDNNE